MGVFNKSIPTISREFNHTKVNNPPPYYVDDIFDPIFNANVKNALRQKYGNAVLGTLGGYAEGINNALIGQNDQWGILGPGMGILSGFGRSMDKAGDAILGTLTEGVKGITGQGFENPLRNIFVDDEDYSGTRLLAAMSNSMADMAGAPRLTERDFKGLWNVPGTAIDFMTDPGVLGSSIARGAGKTVGLTGKLLNQGANPKVAKAGRLLADYDDLMAKVSLDITAPGLRYSSKKLLNKIQQALGNASAKAWADVVLDNSRPIEERKAAQKAMREDPELQTMMEMHDEVKTVDNTIETNSKMVPTDDVSMNESPYTIEFEDELTKSKSDTVREAYMKDLEADEANTEALVNNETNILKEFHRSIRADDIANSKAESEFLQEMQSNFGTNLNSDLTTNRILYDDDSIDLANEEFQKVKNVVDRIRQMSDDELSASNLNRTYATSLDWLPDNYTPEDLQDFISSRSYLSLTDNEATNNTILKMAGLDPKSRSKMNLDTPVTLSPSYYTGRSDTSYVKGIEATNVILRDAFSKADVPLDNIKTPKDFQIFLDPKTPEGIRFKRLIPNEKERKNMFYNIRKLLFPKEFSKTFKSGALDYMKLADKVSNDIIVRAEGRAKDTMPLALRVFEAADEAGLPYDEYLRSLKERVNFKNWLNMMKFDELSSTDKMLMSNMYDTLTKDFDLSDSSVVQSLMDASNADSIRRATLGTDSYTSEFYDTIRQNIDPTELKAMDQIDSYLLAPEQIEAMRNGTLPELSMYDDVAMLAKYDNMYNKYWEDLFNESFLYNKTADSKLYDTLTEAAESIRRDVLNPINQRMRYNPDVETVHYNPNIDVSDTGADNLGSVADVKKFENDIETKAKKVITANPKTNLRKTKSSDLYTYQFYNVYTNLLRKNPELFKDPKNFYKMVNEVLPRISNNYQIKFKPEFFFGDIPTGIPVSTLHSKGLLTKLPEASSNILGYGDAVVRAFEQDVLPDVQLLLKNNIIPWQSKYKPQTKELQDALNRVQSALGFTKQKPHPMYKEFRILQKRLGLEKVGDKYLFKLYDPEDLAKTALGESQSEFYTVPRAVFDADPKHIDYFGRTFIPRYTKIDLPKSELVPKISTTNITIQDYVDMLNARVSPDFRTFPKVQNASKGIEKAISFNPKLADSSSDAVKGVTPTTTRITNETASQMESDVAYAIQEAPENEVAEIVTNFPTPEEAAKQHVIEKLVPNHETIETVRKVSPPPTGGGENIPPESPSPEDIFSSKHSRSTYDIINEAYAAQSSAKAGKKFSVVTSRVHDIMYDAHMLTKDGILSDDIAKYKRATTYLDGASVTKDQFMNNLASSGMIMSAFPKSEAESMRYFANRLLHNVGVVNRAFGGSVLKVHKQILPNGNTMIGAYWDTSNKNILKLLDKNSKKLNINELIDLERLPKGKVTPSVAEYLASDKYRKISQVFDATHEMEQEYSKLLGLTFDDAPHHIKNVRNMSPDLANYLKQEVYRGIPVDDLDELTDRMVNLDMFKSLRGAWGTRRYDKRLLGYIEDFETGGMRIFNDDPIRIVGGALGEGSFANSKFQTYLGLFNNKNFAISTYAKTPDDLKRLLYAKLPDGTTSGNLQNFTLAAPKYNADGRIIGFTKFDKLSDAGLQRALDNPETIMLPNNVLAPLDKVLRKDLKMSNKVYAFINKHFTLPFKFGVLMNPGFLVGNASDAYWKQATTMAQKYGTSVPEELANVSVAVSDVIRLNNEFDDAYRKFLDHMELEKVHLAPSSQVSGLAATDPRVRKILTDYVHDRLPRANGSLIDCKLNKQERGRIKLWMMLNSSSVASTFDAGLRDFDDVAKAANKSKYDMPSNIIDRVMTGKGEYVKDDVKTWGLFINNPAAKAIMDTSEQIENVARSASILNDLRHSDIDLKYFEDYFDTLEDLKEAIDEYSKKGEFGMAGAVAELRDTLKKEFNVRISEATNAMHNANFDYESITDFTDTIGTFVPFPTFFLKNMGYWMDIFVNNPKYIDKAISLQEGLWGSKDTSKDEFLAEAKGRGALPLEVGGQKLSKFFKGIYKPTPMQSMFGAFGLLNSPMEDLFFRLHPALASGIAATSEAIPAVGNVVGKVIPEDAMKYRPYSTDMYERNVSKEDPNFNPALYALHRSNPMERALQTTLRLPDKLKNNQAQLSDFLPSIFQPDFSKKS